MRSKRTILNRNRIVNRPLNPSPTLLTKLGRIVQEAVERDRYIESFISAELQDSEVLDWLHNMGELGLIPRDIKDGTRDDEIS